MTMPKTEDARKARLRVVQSKLSWIWIGIESDESSRAAKVIRHVAMLRKRQAVLEREEARLLKLGRLRAAEEADAPA